MSKPVDVNNPEYLGYLDALRESGVTNMFGARPYLMREFPELAGERGKLAGKVLSNWIQTFGQRHTAPTTGETP